MTGRHRRPPRPGLSEATQGTLLLFGSFAFMMAVVAWIFLVR